MKPPSERNQAIAARRAEGATFRAIADEFGLSPKRLKEIITRVERYNRGAAILQTDPSSLEGLELIGTISILTRASLSAVGISRLEELDGMSLADLLRLPNIGRRQAGLLIELYAHIKPVCRPVTGA
jgi:hypothetical protein